MKKNLKGVVVLLTIAVMIFSTTSITANTNETPKACVGKQNWQQSIINVRPLTNDRGLLWDNGDPDLVDALACQRIGIVGWADVADDFHLDKKTTIQKVIWETVDTTDYIWNGTDDLIIYQYTPNGPGTEIVEILKVQNTREKVENLWSKIWYRYEIDLEAQGQTFNLQKGDYYILLRPYSAGNTGRSFWMKSTAPAGSTSEGYFRSDYFGYPSWTPISDMFGDPWDFSFKIYGTQDFSREINRPILDFLNDHPNLFPLLQKLLTQLGIGL
jgi:hypothetical protein